MPADWRPHRIEGGWERGAIIVGGPEDAVVQVKWSRPGGKGFDAARWLRRRARSVRVRGVSYADGPRPAGFSHTAWVAAYAPRGSGKGALWYGYAPGAGLAVEVVVSGEARATDASAAVHRVLPSLRVSGAHDPTRWSIYGSSFVSPPGFRLVERRLNLGDVALLFASGSGERLMLRQVYPARLALARRELARWLEFPVFKEYRRFRSDGPARRFEVAAGSGALAGIRRDGTKRLAFPLGGWRRRRSTAGVVHDEGLDRLLLVEYDRRGEEAESLVSAALASMNWAQRGAGGAR